MNDEKFYNSKNELLITTLQATAISKLTRPRIIQLINRNEITAYRVGREFLLLESDVLKLQNRVEQRGRKPKPKKWNSFLRCEKSERSERSLKPSFAFYFYSLFLLKTKIQVKQFLTPAPVFHKFILFLRITLNEWNEWNEWMQTWKLETERIGFVKTRNRLFAARVIQISMSEQNSNADTDKPNTDSETDKPDETQTETESKTEKTFTQADINRIVKRETEKVLKNAKLSDDERTKAELADLKAELAARNAKDVFTEIAAKANVKNTNALYRLYKDDLEFDDKGKITNADEILKTAKSEMPELFQTSGKNVDAKAKDDGSKTFGNSMNDLIRGKR